MSDPNPITEAVRAVVDVADKPAAANRFPLVQLVAALSDPSTPVTDEAMLLLPQEFRRLALTTLTMAMCGPA